MAHWKTTLNNHILYPLPNYTSRGCHEFNFVNKRFWILNVHSSVMGFDRLKAMLWYTTKKKLNKKVPDKCRSTCNSGRQLFIARNNEKTADNMKRRFINMSDIKINNLWRFFNVPSWRISLLIIIFCSRKNQNDPIVRFVYIELISLLFIESIVYAYRIARRICP